MQAGDQYEKKLQQQLKQQQQQQMRQSILSQILTPQARQRLKPQKVTGIENALIGAAQQGKLRNKVTEQELVAMLESQSKTETSKITFKRRGIDDQW